MLLRNMLILGSDVAMRVQQQMGDLVVEAFEEVVFRAFECLPSPEEIRARIALGIGAGMNPEALNHDVIFLDHVPAAEVVVFKTTEGFELRRTIFVEKKEEEMFGEPKDVDGECNAHLYIADDYGDNHSTMRCQLPEGHEGLHKETFQREGGEVTITWPHDERGEYDIDEDEVEEEGEDAAE